MSGRLVRGTLVRNIVLYGVIGLVASATDAIVFSILAYLAGIPALVSNVISVPVGILISFTLNRKYNFKVTDHAFRRGAIFFTVGGVGFVLSQLTIWIGLNMGAQAIAAKLVSIMIVAVVQFTLNKLISFGVRFDE